MTIRVTGCLTAALVLAAPAAAQRGGTVEVGGFARYADFDNSLGMGTTVAVGGRAAVYVGPALAVELDVSRGSAGRDLLDDPLVLHHRARDLIDERAGIEPDVALRLRLDRVVEGKQAQARSGFHVAAVEARVEVEDAHGIGARRFGCLPEP